MPKCDEWQSNATKWLQIEMTTPWHLKHKNCPVNNRGVERAKSWCQRSQLRKQEREENWNFLLICSKKGKKEEIKQQNWQLYSNALPFWQWSSTSLKARSCQNVTICLLGEQCTEHPASRKYRWKQRLSMAATAESSLFCNENRDWHNRWNGSVEMRASASCFWQEWWY